MESKLRFFVFLLFVALGFDSGNLTSLGKASGFFIISLELGFASFVWGLVVAASLVDDSMADGVTDDSCDIGAEEGIVSVMGVIGIAAGIGVGDGCIDGEVSLDEVLVGVTVGVG